MKLTKQDILNIDKYLKKKGIKHMDVRYELIDHLVSEYEQIENYPDLESFLRKRVAWCKEVAKSKEKAVGNGYHKAIWKRMWSFFKEPLFYIVLLIWLFFLWTLKANVVKSIFEDTLFFILVGIIALQLVLFLWQEIKSMKIKQVLSYQYLFQINSVLNKFQTYKTSPFYWFIY